MTIRAIEPLDVRVLGRFPRLNVQELHTVRFSPLNEVSGQELWTIVYSQPRRTFAPGADLVEQPGDPLDGQRGVDLYGQPFSIEACRS